MPYNKKNKINSYKWLSFVAIGGCATLAITPIALTSCKSPKKTQPTRIVIDGARNNSIPIHSTLNLEGTYQFHCHDDMSGIPTNVTWSIDSTNPSISIDSTSGVLSWKNNLDPNGANNFTLTCSNNILASATCLVSIGVARTPGNDICPNSWFQVDSFGRLSLKNNVDKDQIHKLVIPRELDGTDVLAIATQAFAFCNYLTSVDIPDSLTSISASAFTHCYSLTSLTLPDSLTSIGQLAFAWCSSLTSLTLPNSPISINDSAFAGCSSLKFITFQCPPALIGSDAFSNCSSLTSITYATPTGPLSNNAYVLIDGNGDLLTPGSSDTITNGFLTQYRYVKSSPSPGLISAGCLAVGNIKFPAAPINITSIGQDAFDECSSIKSVTFPSSLTTINARAFNNCSSLNSIVFSNSINSIGQQAFFGCSSLKSIAFPSSLTTIGMFAFDNCSSLDSITFASSPTAIDESAFEGCAITSITYTASPTPWTDDTYVLVDGNGDVLTAGTTTTIHDGFLTMNKFVKSTPSPNLACVSSLAIGNIKFPSTVTSIGSFGFKNCLSLESITLTPAITTISSMAFLSCSSLNLILASYTQAPASFDSVAFMAVASIGTVRNTESSYPSATFLTFLKTKGLPTDWTVS